MKKKKNRRRKNKKAEEKRRQEEESKKQEGNAELIGGDGIQSDTPMIEILRRKKEKRYIR